MAARDMAARAALGGTAHARRYEPRLEELRELLFVVERADDGEVHAVPADDVLRDALDIVRRDGLDARQELLTGIDAVTADDVQRVAQDVIGNHGMNLAVIGPFDDEEKFAKLL